MSRRLFFCDQYTIPLPAGHKFPITKYGLIRELLAADGHFEFECAPFAERVLIELAHDPTYVGQFLSGTVPHTAMRRIGFPWSPGLVERTRASVGGTLSATLDAFNTGWGGNLAGGTHHAFRSEGAGFCVFNDIAIALHWARRDGRIQRAAILDLDVHQGDGTAQIFEDDPNVLTVSLHSKSNFPFRKQHSKLDVEFTDGTGDEEYLRALDLVLPQVFAFEPDILFYQSGVDTLSSDALGNLALSHAGLRERDRRVMAAAQAHRIPFVITLGGGYSQPIQLTAEAHANTFRTAAEIFN
ncbi:MAG: histone deacetylase [Acidobacteriota bacterium]|nr:histone deacetylase [Acidobacteriota bacterium]